jgi:hypothetical protein
MEDVLPLVVSEINAQTMASSASADSSSTWKARAKLVVICEVLPQGRAITGGGVLGRIAAQSFRTHLEASNAWQA